MYNKSGIHRVTGTAPRQILANVQLQASIGVILSKEKTWGDFTGQARKIIKAGTPLHVDFTNYGQADAVEPVGEEAVCNAVLLHDVELFDGMNANATALYLGVVDLAKVHADVKTELLALSAHSPLLVFLAEKSS